MPAPVTKSMLSGMRKQRASGAASFSANAPVVTWAITRSPFLTRVTFAPIASTTPEASRPGTNGRSGRVWYLPCSISVSGKLSPIAFTSISTS